MASDVEKIGLELEDSVPVDELSFWALQSVPYALMTTTCPAHGGTAWPKLDT